MKKSRFSEIGIDAPVSNCIRIGQRVARHRAAKAHVVKLGGLAAQACFDVAQALAIGFEIPRMLLARFKSRPSLIMKYFISINLLQSTRRLTLGH